MITLNNIMGLRGLSTDQKPTQGIRINTRFWEIDTNKYFYFDGSAWQTSPSETGELEERMAQAEEDIRNLEEVANDPVYDSENKLLQLYDTLNGDIPISFDTTKYVDITPEEASPQIPVAYKFKAGSGSYTNEHRFDMVLNRHAFDNGSKYYMAALSGAATAVHTTTQDFVVIEYRPSGEGFKLYAGGASSVTFLPSAVSGPYANRISVSSTAMESFTDEGNFRVARIRFTIACTTEFFRGMIGFYKIDWSSSPETLTGISTIMATGDYTAGSALEALDFELTIPQKDMEQLYVADTIYKPVDTVARAGMPEANPEEEATAVLTKIKIGNVVYSLPSGGGGLSVPVISASVSSSFSVTEGE